MRRGRVPQDSFETCFLLFPYFTVSFFGSGVCVFKALQFQGNQNCRCERTRIRMLGTRQLRAQLAVGESVRQSVLLHRNLNNWVWSKVLRLIYMYMHIWYILWIYVTVYGISGKQKPPICSGIDRLNRYTLQKESPLLQSFHPVMQQILHLLRFIYQISISSLLVLRQCGRETVPRHPKGCQMDG